MREIGGTHDQLGAGAGDTFRAVGATNSSGDNQLVAGHVMMTAPALVPGHLAGQ